MIMALVLNGFQFTYEERLFDRYYIEPLELVGLEGCFGVIGSTLLVVAMSYVPCNFGQEACVLDYAGMPFIEGPRQYFA